MTEGPITLGHAGEHPLDLDLDRLIGSHLGIVANAGGEVRIAGCLMP